MDFCDFQRYRLTTDRSGYRVSMASPKRTGSDLILNNDRLDAPCVSWIARLYGLLDRLQENLQASRQVAGRERSSSLESNAEVTPTKSIGCSTLTMCDESCPDDFDAAVKSVDLLTENIVVCEWLNE